MNEPVNIKTLPYSTINLGDEHVSVSWDEFNHCVAIADSRVKRKRGVVAFLDETEIPAKWKIILEPMHDNQLDADIAIRIGGYVQVVSEFIRVNLPELEIPEQAAKVGWKRDLTGNPFLQFGRETYRIPEKPKRDLYEALVVGHDLFSGEVSR